MNSPKILQTSRRSRGYRSLSNEISGEADIDPSVSTNNTIRNEEVYKKVNKRNSVKERTVEEKTNDSRSECKPVNSKDNKNYRKSLSTYKTLQVYDELNNRLSTNRSSAIMINDNKNHEKPGTLHKLLLSLPINRIKKDHLCTTQSAPCSPIFMKKEQVNITHNLLNVERITSPYLKKKNNIHLNPLNETATTRPSTSSPLTANLKYLNDNLSIHRNKSKCQKINNGISSNHNKLNNLPLTQLELNIQQFKMIRKKLDEQQVNSNQNDDKLKHMKTPLNNECSKAQKQIRILGSKTDLSTSYSQGVKRLETPPPSYSDLEILNSSSRDNLLTKNTDKSNFTLLSTIDDQVHIYNRSIHPTETDKNQLINKHSNDNYNIDKCNYMTTNMIPSISSADYTNYSNSYTLNLRHNASERFGMRLERTKGVRQVTYIAMILPRSPAQLAGLKVGDRLIRVNELETDQMLLEDSNSFGYYFMQRNFTVFFLDDKGFTGFSPARYLEFFSKQTKYIRYHHFFWSEYISP
ncbi:unnamed protein product [Heterobilharzia americana]|nr:unnamed protein product [Heterobilharzia americana]